jgi:5-methylcytosine-specific restriction endonuclease McrA
MRHAVPNGDPAVIIDRALTLLVEQLERTKFAKRKATWQRVATRHNRAGKRPSRHTPAAVKREVWARDAGRCAYSSAAGRCRETAMLEFHHRVPFADGGEPTAANIELRCRGHNQYEADRWSGRELGWMETAGHVKPASDSRTRSGPS